MWGSFMWLTSQRQDCLHPRSGQKMVCGGRRVGLRDGRRRDIERAVR